MSSFSSSGSSITERIVLYEHLVAYGTKLLEEGEQYIEQFCHEVKHSARNLIEVVLFKDESQRTSTLMEYFSSFSTYEKYPLQCCGRYYGWLLFDLSAEDDRSLLPGLIRTLAEFYGTIFYALEVSAITCGRSQFSTRAPRPALTSRQRAILQLMVQGYKEEEIAEILQIETNTVRKHRESIYARLGVHTSREAIQAAFLFGLCQPLSNLVPIIL